MRGAGLFSQLAKPQHDGIRRNDLSILVDAVFRRRERVAEAR